LVVDLAVAHLHDQVLEHRHVDALAVEFGMGVGKQPDGLARPQRVGDMGLGLGHQALLALEQDVLPVVFEFFGTERLGARNVDELAVPRVLTLHTVRVVHGPEQVLLDAGPAHIKIAKSTCYLFAIHFVEFFAAYRAVRHDDDEMCNYF
jgi:hypothetical protein